jgi:hypothetical protein
MTCQRAAQSFARLFAVPPFLCGNESFERFFPLAVFACACHHVWRSRPGTAGRLLRRAFAAVVRKNERGNVGETAK